MYLTKIEIASKEVDATIRDIEFKQGLNLVIDSGKNQESGSGNDIGKTTFIRSIDFCLGSSIDELYVDRDEKKRNEETFKFLTQQKISFTLTVGYRFGAEDIVLRRWFEGANGNKAVVKQSIDGDECGIRAYTAKLNELFFRLSSKPSFRDLIPKFIREDKNSTGSLLRYLGSFKSNEEYNSIHLVLFGFRDMKLLKCKSALVQKRKELDNKIAVYEKDYGDINELESFVAVTEKDLEDLLQERDTIQQKLLDISSLETDLDTLNELAKEISHTNGKIAQYEIDVKNIQANIKRLEKEGFDVDVDEIKHVYQETKLYNDSMHKEFEDIVRFHNTMIQNKISFSEKALHRKEHKLKELYEKRRELAEKYELRKNGKEEELFEELNEKNDAIMEVSNRLEVIKNALSQIKYSKAKLKKVKRVLGKIEKRLEEKKDELQKNLNIFNIYFASYTKKLYDEENYVHFGKTLLDPFEVSAKFNPGDGKKKALITAFDLAYAAFVKDLSLGYPLFVAEDQVELIDVNQLSMLFDIANSMGTQLIIPVLKSKIESIDIKKEDILFTLSEEDKFFRF